MCFSAAASFTAALFTGAAGAAAVRRVKQPRALPFAAIPLLFSVQQAVEGWLWLSLGDTSGGRCATVLTETFLVFALVLWPVYAPLSALLLEQDTRRRTAIGACLIVGMAVSLYLGGILWSGTHAATIADGHIVYASSPEPSRLVGPFYLLATGLGPALSSHRAVNALAGIVLAGSLIAWLAYWDAFVSLWCFFAAAASLVVLAHFSLGARVRHVVGRATDRS